MPSNRRGKLIVFEGTDASGKGTQSNHLIDFLKSKEVSAEYIDFPQYYNNFYGRMVGQFLNGEFGELDECHPHLVSTIYAMDRLESKPTIERWLHDEKFVVINRYVGSNMAHQSAKLPEREWDECSEMIEEMEYEVNGLPKEDLVIFLYIPTKWSTTLLTKKEDREYLNGKKRDIAEAHVKHQELAEKVFLRLVEKKNHWIKVDCIDEYDNLRSIEDIQKEIQGLVMPLLRKS